MNIFKQHKFLWLLCAIGSINLGLLLGSGFMVDKFTDRVADRLIERDATTTNIQFQSERIHTNMNESKVLGEMIDNVERTSWRESWEKSRSASQ